MPVGDRTRQPTITELPLCPDLPATAGRTATRGTSSLLDGSGTSGDSDAPSSSGVEPGASDGPADVDDSAGPGVDGSTGRDDCPDKGPGAGVGADVAVCEGTADAVVDDELLGPRSPVYSVSLIVPSLLVLSSAAAVSAASAGFGKEDVCTRVTAAGVRRRENRSRRDELLQQGRDLASFGAVGGRGCQATPIQADDFIRHIVPAG